MKFSNTSILETACELPPKFLSSDEIETQLTSLYNKLNLPKGRLQ